MNLSAKRHLGLLLIFISVVAAVIWVIFRGDWHFIDGNWQNGFGIAGELKLSWQYALPILACGMAGVAFLAASMRKPPKQRD